MVESIYLQNQREKRFRTGREALSSHQLQHLAGTDRNQVQAQSTQQVVTDCFYDTIHINCSTYLLILSVQKPPAMLTKANIVTQWAPKDSPGHC